MGEAIRIVCGFVCHLIWEALEWFGVSPSSRAASILLPFKGDWDFRRDRVSETGAEG